MTYRPWTTAELRMLKSEYEDGVMVKDIAAALGRSRNSVSSQVLRRGYFRQYMSANGKRKPWTTGEVKMMEQLYVSGLPISEIARTMGRTLKTASNTLSRQRISSSARNQLLRVKALADRRASRNAKAN